MQRSGQQIMTDVAQRAMETFQRNSDTIVAGFLVRHPDVDPADVELVMRVEGSTFKFRLEPKELHVPDALPSSTTGSDADAEYVYGWNACRAEMLKLAKAVKDQDGTMVTLLSEVMPNG